MFKKQEHEEVQTPKGGATTVIAGGTHFNGVLRVSGSVRVDGEVEGQLEVSETLTVGSNGVLKAEVAADSAVIAGRVKGRIWAKGKVALERGARLEGDVHAKTFKIEDGAFFQGNCTMGEGRKEVAPAKPGAVTPKQAGSGDGVLKVIGD
ncbi:polymer-forming cytoskeletal protein [Candidatus Eisenbacteria bacterium]|uniref:Polymer-forming cytoskeletal protein n=1 Tax=Eiseniibacteriota bacterium TaxID=2212470 RepID=A0ABV6YKA5_UNCEI